MTALVVVAHPDPTSLTHHVAREVQADLARDGERVELADLAAEGFDPRWTVADLEAYRGGGTLPTPPEVRAEQDRLDRAEHVVLVFPLYWWSVPGLLKGWIDRVFVNGWAFDDTGARAVGLLGRMTLHLVAVAGEDEEGFVRHGYADAFRTQLVHGVAGYCGARFGASTVLFDSESTSSDTVASRVGEVVDRVRAAVDAVDAAREPAALSGHGE